MPHVHTPATHLGVYKTVMAAAVVAMLTRSSTSSPFRIKTCCAIQFVRPWLMLAVVFGLVKNDARRLFTWLSAWLLSVWKVDETAQAALWLVTLGLR